MEFQSIKKLGEGKFISRYDLTYKTKSGNEKIYEIISRDPNIDSFEKLKNHPVDAVVLIMHDAAGERVLLNREYRMAVGNYVYNFPAGLIDPGEEPLESAKRELWEETGLTLSRVDDTIRESYSAVGFANEKNICVVGVAEGEFAPSTSDVEEIEAGWYTKAEIRELLKTEAFAARTQAYCYVWSRS